MVHYFLDMQYCRWHSGLYLLMVLKFGLHRKSKLGKPQKSFSCGWSRSEEGGGGGGVRTTKKERTFYDLPYIIPYF